MIFGGINLEMASIKTNKSRQNLTLFSDTKGNLSCFLLGNVQLISKYGPSHTLHI